jgi:serine/threonine-protein kinase
MQRDVALKVLRARWLDDEEFRQRFLLEAQHVGKMSHQNLIQVFDVGMESDQLYFSMEYIPGKNVQQLIDEHGPLEVEQAIEITIQIARAINYYKDHGIVHRDIKPSNIFVTPQGVAKLGDFGFIKTEIDKEISMEGYILGTPDYISPEQAVGADDLDYRSDIYSLGASLYHMLTGKTPYGGTESSVIRQHIKLDLPSPSSFRSDLPEELVLILERMMAKRPEDRYDDLAVLCDELALVRKGRSVRVQRIAVGKSSILRDVELSERQVGRLEHEREGLRGRLKQLSRERDRLRVACLIVGIIALLETMYILAGCH